MDQRSNTLISELLFWGSYNLITAPLFDGTTPEDSLVVINLETGEIRINLEKLHGQDLNGLDPNTPLNTAQVAQITETVDNLLDALLNRVSNTLNQGILDTALVIDLPATNKGILGGVLGEVLGEIRIESSLGGLLGATGFAAPSITYDGLILGAVGGLIEPAVNGIIRPLGGAIQGLLENEVSDIVDVVLRADVLNSLLNGLTPVLDEVLTEVLAITINRHDNVTIDGQPGLRVTALDIQLLPVIAGDNNEITPAQVTPALTQLGLATSQVSGPSAANLTNWAPEITVIPDEGPFGEPQTVTIAGNNLVYVDGGAPTNLVTELTFGDVAIPASAITANSDGSLTVEVPAATAEADEERRPVTVTLTTGGGSDTDEFAFVATPDVDPAAPKITPIDNQTGTVDTPITPIDVEVAPDTAEVTVEGLPDGLTYNEDTGEITGTPTEVGVSTVTVTAVNDGRTVTETFTITITERDGSGNGSGGDGSSDNGSGPGSSNGSGNGSSDNGNGNGGIDNGSSAFLQQCLSSPAGGLVGLLAALGAVSAIAGPALEPLLKSIGSAVDQQIRQLNAATSGAHQPE